MDESRGEGPRLPLVFYRNAAQSIYRFPPESDLSSIFCFFKSHTIDEGEILNISITSEEISIVTPSRLDLSNLVAVADYRVESGWSLIRVLNPPSVRFTHSHFLRGGNR